jgi:3-dehydroquinate dehydratase/shikimate dehydrogenase
MNAPGLRDHTASRHGALVCVPMMVEDAGDALIAAGRAKDAGADLVEYRVDHLFSGEGDDDGQAAVLDLVARSPLPCIVTCRPACEGGGYDGDDSARVSLFEALGTADRSPAYIDVEAQTYNRSANLRQKVNLAVNHPEQVREVGSRLILSQHDFEGRPAGLLRTFTDLRQHGAASVLKIAFRARSLRDNLEVFELLREKDRPTIALAMGADGLMSRVLAGKFGGFLTFASLDRRDVTAPGQPTLHELLGLYRFRAVGPDTRVFGVIGDPVTHSASPAVHNAAFDDLDFNGVYLPLRVSPGWEAFKATVLSLLGEPGLDFAGASVTIPHKEHLLRLASADDSGRRWSIDDAAALAGAANTLCVHTDGACRIANTDATALTDVVRHALDAHSLADVRVAVLGSGGVSRAAAAGLALHGATVTIAARNDQTRTALVEQLTAGLVERAAPGAVDGVPWDRRHDLTADVFVNATPVGMRVPDHSPTENAKPGSRDDHDADTPIDLDKLTPAAEPVVIDTVYTPPDTALLRAAAAAGLRTVDGVEMFARQAAEQSRRWTGADLGHDLFLSRARDWLAR